jgi:hypothetical protein
MFVNTEIFEYHFRDKIFVSNIGTNRKKKTKIRLNWKLYRILITFCSSRCVFSSLLFMKTLPKWRNYDSERFTRIPINISKHFRSWSIAYIGMVVFNTFIFFSLFLFLQLVCVCVCVCVCLYIEKRTKRKKIIWDDLINIG